MANDPIGIALNALNKIAGSETADKLGLRKPVENIAHVATREGFRAAAAAARQFQAVQQLLQPERLPKPADKPKVFDLTPTEEQEMFIDSLRRFAEQEIREAAFDADNACAAPAEMLQHFNDFGLTAMAVPETLGGHATEHSPMTSVLIAEQLAYGDLSLAVAALAPIGVANALVRWGSADQQATYLPAFVEENPPQATIALCEPRPMFDPSNLSCRATSTEDGFVLNGVKSMVPLGGTADLLLVAAALDTKGPQVFIVEPGAAGVTIETEPGMGLRATGLSRLTFDNVKLPQMSLLGEKVGACDYTELVDLGRLMWCALAVGTGQAVLDYVIPYCNERVAFGEPITHRQSVAFMIANLAIEVDGMRILTYKAASRAEQGLPFHREAYLARIFCADKGMEIGTNGVQLLGGHGFVKEHPVERWYRDLRAVGVAEGGLLA